MIVSSQKLAKNLIPAVLTSSECHHVIGMEPLRSGQTPDWVNCHSWGKLASAEADVGRLRQDVSSVSRDDLACLIYTSGTGGAPRGVQQHHGSILANLEGATDIISTDFGWGDEIFLSFLPASHAYEHTGGQHFPIALGGQIYYAESLEKLASNIEEVQPTIMVVVPRLFEMLRARIIKSIEVAAAAFRNICCTERSRSAPTARQGRSSRGTCRWTGCSRSRCGGRSGRRSAVGRKRGSRAAHRSTRKSGLFFESLGITFLQGYGQTEAGPVISCNRPSAGIRLDTVGPPVKNAEVRIADDGEIMIRGEIVMHGYWRNPEETARVLRDGWLATGDVGHFDDKGRIVITDRKKDLLVNDKGDNVSPQRIEGMLTLQPEIAQAMVYGDRRPHLVALLVPDPEIGSSAGCSSTASEARSTE